MNLKKVSRGVIATSAMFCLLSFGALAQDQATSAGSTKKSHKASSAATSDSTSQVSAADKAFVMKAAQGGLAEVQLGQLAAENGQSDQVKQFGSRMVDDHGKANDQLKQIAMQKGLAVPNDLSAKDKAEKDRLSKLKGAQFDKAYMQHMLVDHKKDIAEFKKESTSGKDNDIKNFASQTLPTLEEHLKLAQQTSASTGAAKGTAKSAAKSTTTASTNPKQ